MALNDLLERLARRADTPNTQSQSVGVSAKTLPLGACTLVTTDTSQNNSGTNEDEKVGAGNTSTVSNWWLIHYSDRDPMEVACCSEVTHSEILDRYRDAVAAEPMTPIDPEAWEERAAIAKFDGGLSRDEAERLAWLEDDRRTCTQCINLRQRVCAIAKPEAGALVVANRGYRPDRARLLRCAGFAPIANDQDQRTGVMRWPGLTNMKGTK